MPLIACLLALASLFAAPVYAVEPPPQLAARAWLLLDHASDQVLAMQNADEKIEPASLTKIMTSYVAYVALRDGRLQRDQVAKVSEKAWKAIGSRMFIEPGQPVTIDQLLHGVVIQSGNDASIALAEAIAGSEESFVALMNEEARRLGMKNTHFANASGLTEDSHLTTVNDLAILTKALIRDFPQEYKMYSAKDYTWNNIRQPNRNRLLWLDDAIDGVKTGHTDAAGYCLIASRNDGARRLTAIVVGAASKDARVQETLSLLHYGSRAYEAVKLYDRDQPLAQLRVFKGDSEVAAAGFDKDLVLSLPRGVAASPERIRAEVSSRQPLIAPVKRGDVIATLRLSLDGEHYDEYPLQALADVPLAGFLGRTWDSLRLWFE